MRWRFWEDPYVTKVGPPICFNLWDRLLAWLFPRTYDPWFDVFLVDPPMDRIETTDGDLFYKVINITLKSLLIGKQEIYNEIIASLEIRYAKFTIAFRRRPRDGTESRCINIPIPFMKKDHGVLVWIR